MENEFKLGHQNDRIHCGFIITHCPVCEGERILRTSRRTIGDPIVVNYLSCRACGIFTPCISDDRDATILGE